MGGTRGSGVVSSADDVLEISVVHGMRGVGRVCEMCMRLARGTAQRKILHLANWSQLIHPGPASSMTKFFFGVESIMRVNAASLDIQDATTSTPGTLNDLTTDLIMANNNNNRGEWVRGLSLGFTNPVGTGECGTCVCVWVAVV